MNGGSGVLTFMVALVFAAISFLARSLVRAIAAVVSIEIMVIMINRFRCPLTDVAARYTDDRDDNFDIYLPFWLARYNKQIFGTLFVAGLLITLLMWSRAGVS